MARNDSERAEENKTLFPTQIQDQLDNIFDLLETTKLTESPETQEPAKDDIYYFTELFSEANVFFTSIFVDILTAKTQTNIESILNSGLQTDTFISIKLTEEEFNTFLSITLSNILVERLQKISPNTLTHTGIHEIIRLDLYRLLLFAYTIWQEPIILKINSHNQGKYTLILKNANKDIQIPLSTSAKDIPPYINELVGDYFQDFWINMNKATAIADIPTEEDIKYLPLLKPYLGHDFSPPSFEKEDPYIQSTDILDNEARYANNHIRKEIPPTLQRIADKHIQHTLEKIHKSPNTPIKTETVTSFSLSFMDLDHVLDSLLLLPYEETKHIHESLFYQLAALLIPLRLKARLNTIFNPTTKTFITTLIIIPANLPLDLDNNPEKMIDKLKKRSNPMARKIVYLQLHTQTLQDIKTLLTLPQIHEEFFKIMTENLAHYEQTSQKHIQHIQSYLQIIYTILNSEHQNSTLPPSYTTKQELKQIHVFTTAIENLLSKLAS